MRGNRGALVVLACTSALGMVGCGLPSDSPPPPSVDTVASGDTLDVDETYQFALYAHCGMDYLGQFNGRQWGPRAAPTPEEP